MFKPQKLLIVFLLMTCFMSFVGVSADESNGLVYVYSDPTYNRVRIQLSITDEPTAVRPHLRQTPAMVGVDIVGKGLDAFTDKRYRSDDSYLRSVEIRRTGTDSIRVSASLASPSGMPKVQFYSNSKQKFFLIDIDRPARYQQPKWTPRELDRSKQREIPVVVIDPGHGGYDPGAISRYRGRLQEKDVVLDVAREVERILKADGRVYPVLTRYGDIYPTLEERVELVNKSGADLFVSVHADSAPGNSKASGFGVWLLPENNRYADRYAKNLLMQSHPNTYTAKLVRQPKVILSQNRLLAQNLLYSMERETRQKGYRIDNRGIKRNNFKVLRHYFCPSALIELGFLSNASDAQKLASNDFRNVMAQAIANGIINHFRHSQQESPPIRPKAILADAKTYDKSLPTVPYTIKRGDNLTKIADLFNVTVEDICLASNLSPKQHIYAGQELRIPLPPRKAQRDISPVVDNIERIVGSSSQTEPQTRLAMSSPPPNENYRVKRGDTLSTIASRYGVRVEDLRRLNKLRGDLIKPNQILQIPNGNMTSNVFPDDWDRPLPELSTRLADGHCAG